MNVLEISFRRAMSFPCDEMMEREGGSEIAALPTMGQITANPLLSAHLCYEARMKDFTHASRKDAPVFMAAQVAALASTGFSKRGISRHFGVSLQTFNPWLDEDAEASEAFLNGREHERQALHNMLYKLAIEEKDKVSAMFLLKAAARIP